MVTGRGSDAPRLRARLDRNVELHYLMRWWRRRLDPRRLSCPVSRCRRTVSQEMMAELVGVSALWYGRLERGELEPNYSDDFLDKVAGALQLNKDERAVLYLLTVGRQPTSTNNPENNMDKNALRRVVDSQTWPAYVSSPAWDVVFSNKAMVEWFPHIEHESNIMRWVFCDPQARRQLVDWDKYWAPRMLALLRGAHARWPDDQQLTEVIVEALSKNSYARRLWDSKPEVCLHPDGARCQLYRPSYPTPQQVEVVAFSPESASDLQLMILVPVDTVELVDPP